MSSCYDHHRSRHTQYKVGDIRLGKMGETYKVSFNTHFDIIVLPELEYIPHQLVK